MRSAVGFGSLTKMSWSILHRFCLYALPGHLGISRWLGIPSDCLSRISPGERFTNQYSNGCVFVKE